MGKKHGRTRVAAATSGLAIAALLAGPALTFGLDVGTAPVTSAVQTVTTTVQQTTNTAVSTVQTAVQTVAPAPVQQVVQPAVQQVASTIAPTATPKTAAPAPASAATRSVQKTTSVLETTRSAVQHVVAATRPAAATTSHVAAAATRGAATVANASARHHVAVAPLTSGKRAASAHASLIPCDELIQLLPAIPGLDGLLAVVCNITDGVLPTGSAPPVGGAPSPVDATVGVLGATIASLGQAQGHALRPAAHTAHRRDERSATAPAAGTGLAAAGAPAVAATGDGASVASPAGSGIAAASASAASGAAKVSPRAHDGGILKHLGGLDSRGSQVLALFLLIDGVLLGCLLVWRFGRRWVFPHAA